MRAAPLSFDIAPPAQSMKDGVRFAALLNLSKLRARWPSASLAQSALTGDVGIEPQYCVQCQLDVVHSFWFNIIGIKKAAWLRNARAVKALIDLQRTAVPNVGSQGRIAGKIGAREHRDECRARVCYRRCAHCGCHQRKIRPPPAKWRARIPLTLSTPSARNGSGMQRKGCAGYGVRPRPDVWRAFDWTATTMP